MRAQARESEVNNNMTPTKYLLEAATSKAERMGELNVLEIDDDAGYIDVRGQINSGILLHLHWLGFVVSQISTGVDGYVTNDVTRIWFNSLRSLDETPDYDEEETVTLTLPVGAARTVGERVKFDLFDLKSNNHTDNEALKGVQEAIDAYLDELEEVDASR